MTIDNFTLLIAGKLLVAFWGSLWDFECNSTNRKPTVLKLRGNDTNNKPKKFVVEWSSYRPWCLKHDEENKMELLKGWRMASTFSTWFLFVPYQNNGLDQ